MGRVVEKKKIETEKNEAGHEWELGGKKKKRKKKMGKRDGKPAVCVSWGRKRKKWKREDGGVGYSVGVLGIGGCVWEEGDEEWRGNGRKQMGVGCEWSVGSGVGEKT